MKAIFIDRDGVINKDPGGWTKYNYVTRWEDFHFIPGSREALKTLYDKGYDIVLVSNQGGISKKYFSHEELDLVTGKMLSEIEASGAKIRKVYYCPHQDRDNCSCRKPKTGMLERAGKELGYDIRGSFFIGDAVGDIEAGSAAGLKTALVLSGKSSREDADKWKVRPDFIFKDLSSAVKFIVG